MIMGDTTESNKLHEKTLNLTKISTLLKIQNLLKKNEKQDKSKELIKKKLDISEIVKIGE